MPKLVFHIGHAKTATTYLQHAMHLNSNVFDDAGCYIPYDYTQYGGQNLLKLAQLSRIFSGNAGQLFFDVRDGRNQLLDVIINDAEGRDVILSTELIFYYPDTLAQITEHFRKNGYDLHVIAYLARYEKSIVSGYVQNIRNHLYSGGVCDFLRRTQSLRYFMYESVLSSIVEMCAPDILSVRTFDKTFLVDGDILKDFIHCLDLDLLAVPGLDLPVRKSNESLALEVLELLRVVNRSGQIDKIDACRAQNPPLTDSERSKIFEFYYVQEVRWIIQDLFHEDRQNLIKKYLHDKPREEKEYWMKLPAAIGSDNLDIDYFKKLVEQIL